MLVKANRGGQSPIRASKDLAHRDEGAVTANNPVGVHRPTNHKETEAAWLQDALISSR
jgi:hypothetical protein